jgi:pteridine reductase
MFDLRKKTALITGAAKRVGRSLAIELAKQGTNIVIHYNTSETEANTLRRDLIDLGVNAFLIKADLADPNSSSKLIEGALADAGELDILINTASVFTVKSIQDSDIADLNTVLMVNAWTPFTLSKVFAQKVGHGRIINFLDTRIKGYDLDRFPYYLSKRMLEILTRSLALKLSPNITVNAVAPGLILPPAGKDVNYLKKLKHTVPLKMHGSVSDVVNAVLFLLRSDFITGQVIYVDGGKHLVHTFEGL